MKTWKTAVLGIFAAAVLLLAWYVDTLGNAALRGNLPAVKSHVVMSFHPDMEDSRLGMINVRNDGDCMYCYIGPYTLQRKWGNIWMTESRKPGAYKYYMLTLPPGKISSWGISLWPYEPLVSGRYRVVIDLVQGNDEICRQEKLLKDGTRITYYEPPEYAEHLTLAAEFYLP